MDPRQRDEIPTCITTLQFDPHDAISRRTRKPRDDLAPPRPITDPDLISGGPVNLSTESGKIPEISPAQIATSVTSDEKLAAPSTGFQCGSRLLESAISSSVCELTISSYVRYASCSPVSSVSGCPLHNFDKFQCGCNGRNGRARSR